MWPFIMKMVSKIFVEYLNEDKETLTPVLYFEWRIRWFQVEVAMQYNDGYSDNILSFVNNVRTKDGEPMRRV